MKTRFYLFTTFFLYFAFSFLSDCLFSKTPEQSESNLSSDEVTFFVSADTHLGFERMEEWNQIQIKEMNELPGKLYPENIGGIVQKPMGVLIAGDLTENGWKKELNIFMKLYGMKDKPGILKYPVFPCTGNHDRRGGRTTVAKKIKYYFKTLPYSWKWKFVHLICLDEHPDIEKIRWLRKHLKKIPSEEKIVIFFHYSIQGPYSNWWSKKKKKLFFQTIENKNVIAIFHGHYHAEDYYKWEGFDVFNVGSPKYSYKSFAVVQITRKKLQVCYRNYAEHKWSWWFKKEI